MRGLSIPSWKVKKALFMHVLLAGEDIDVKYSRECNQIQKFAMFHLTLFGGYFT